jgi:hypothetical protein
MIFRLGGLQRRMVVCLASVLCVTAPAFARDDLKAMLPMLEQHCYDCHDGDAKEAGLDLMSLKWPPEDSDQFQRWERVFDKVRRDEMPPRSQSQPVPEVRSRFLTAVHDRLHDITLKRQAEQGRVVYRRLNRSEYANTLHDLLGIDTPLREMLPEDGLSHGFDNVGESLNLSVAHLERYLEAADVALREATISTRTAPTKMVRTDYEQTWHDYNHGFQNSQWVNAPDGKLAIVSGGGSIAHGTLRAWSPPVAEARYRFRVRARAMMQRRQESKETVLTHDRRLIARVGVGSKLKDGLTVNQTFYELSPDRYCEFVYETRVPAGHTFSIAPHRVIPESDGERGMVSGMCVVIDWIEIEGPLYQGDWPPRGHRLLYGDLSLEPADPTQPESDLRVASKAPLSDARRLLSKFLPIVFRRPVSDDKIDFHLDLFREQLTNGRSFDQALRAAYKLALTSPQFLFLQETPGKLDDHALAVRLSYGLWGSLPDAELTELAERGTLCHPSVLRAQTERLLRSPKSKRFTQQFLGSWLNLRDIDFTQPDLKLYPEFDSYLQDSMVAESERFFVEMLRNNLSIRNVIDSDFAMLNHRLAEHYGLLEIMPEDRHSGGEPVVERPPESERLVKVMLPQDSRRGGFITQGAVLKVSANGTNTSPVVRGAYFLDRILGTPPDPPPSTVPSVEPDIRGATTIREQLDKHRNQPACAGCHAKLDPPGFALENYDVTGRWRTHYRAIPESAADKIVKNAGSDVRHYIQGLPVQPQYTLADGRSFDDIDAFKQLMLTDTRPLARCMVEKLITHLTGATPQFSDREVIEQILSKTESSEYGLRDLVHEVIQSRVFQTK